MICELEDGEMSRYSEGGFREVWGGGELLCSGGIKGMKVV